jgi:polyisoprenoid-binding protein YceI
MTPEQTKTSEKMVSVKSAWDKAPTGQKVGFECLFTLNRADYGMKWGIDAPKGALGSEVKMVISLEGDVAKAP